MHLLVARRARAPWFDECGVGLGRESRARARGAHHAAGAREVESFPITDRTEYWTEVIPESGFWCKLGARVSFRNPLAKMREGGLWGLRPSAIPHLTPYIGVLHDSHL